MENRGIHQSCHDFIAGKINEDDEGTTSSIDNVKIRNVILKATGRSVNKSVRF